MKKTVIMFIMLATITIASNAQFFVEGSFDLHHLNGNTSDGVKSTSSFSFSISPQVGYRLNNNIAVGTNVSIGYSSINNLNSEKSTNQNWNFSVFGRYRLLGTEKLSLHIETPVGIGGKITKENTKKTLSQSVIFINAFPLVSYNLTEKLSIITKCDFLSLGFTYTNTKNDVGDNITKNNFGFNAQSTIFSSLSNIKIGFIYNF